MTHAKWSNALCTRNGQALGLLTNSYLKTQGIFMPQIVWTDQLSIGNAAIDAEHQKLIQIANELIEAMKSGLSRHYCKKSSSP